MKYRAKDKIYSSSFNSIIYLSLNYFCIWFVFNLSIILLFFVVAAVCQISERWDVIPGCRAADRWMDAEWQFGLVLIRPISSRASSNVWEQSNTVSSDAWGLDWWGAKGNRLLSSLLSCGHFGCSSRPRYNGEAQFSHVIQLISPVQRRWEKPAQINRKDVTHFRKTHVWLMVLMEVLGNRILFRVITPGTL